MNLDRIRHSLAARVHQHALPQALYNEPDAFAFDMAAIFADTWLLAGFEAEIRKSGDYMAFSVGEWPVLVLRDREGRVRAYHNTCRHRGSILCEAGHGNSPRLTCPYHRWTYDLDGRLLAAGRMPEDFTKADYPLNPIHCETIAGAIFICLSDTPPPIDTMRAQLTPMLAPHNLTHAKLAAESTLIEYANWKLVMENARECYHCATGHPELSVTFPVNAGSTLGLDSAERNDFSLAMEALGLPSAAVGEDWWQAARFPLNPGKLAMSMTGAPDVAKRMCDVADGDIGSLRWALEPNVFCHSTAEWTFAFIAQPISPRETHVVAKWLVHEDAVEGVDYHLDQLTELWTRTNLQDKKLAEDNQAGVNSPGYRPGPYSPEAEPLVISFIDWYCDKANAYLKAQPYG